MSRFEVYKTGESLLQTRVNPLGFIASVEPIAALDLFYSDGLVSSCHGKVVFTKKEHPSTQFVIFFPFYCMNFALPSELKQEFEAWSKHFISIDGKE